MTNFEPIMATNSRGILRKTVALSGEQDPICPNSIFLDADKTTTFGRTSSSETSVRLLSSKTPLMISRKHASIAFEDGKWTILDHNSLNGVFLNGQQIPPSSSQEIRPGDRICFGVAIENNVHEFDYTFEIAPCARKRKMEFHEGPEKESKMRKVLRESGAGNKNEPGPSGENLKDCQENLCKARTTASRIQESEKRIESLNLLLAEKEKAYQNQMEEKEKDLAEQLLQQKEALEREKTEQEKYLMELLEDKLRDKEEDLSNQLEQQKAILIAEKEKVESDLLLELDRKLEEKDKELTQRLETQRDRLENILQLKVNEQVQLQEELKRNTIERQKMQGLQENEKKLEHSLEMLREQLVEKQELLEKQQDVTRKAEEMAKKILMEQMEDEFTCIICQELFIQATTLVCSHSFCDFCLKSWLKKKKTCPICRTDIKGTFVRSIVLDSAVDKIVQTMDDETKERRKFASQERKKLSQEVTVIKDSPPHPRLGVGNQRNPIVIGAGNMENDDVQSLGNRAPPQFVGVPRMALPAPGAPPFPQPNPGARRQRRPQGNPGVPYRGHHNHGHCYVCGMRGHWARTCPFR